jgi:hypothetical protein
VPGPGAATVAAGSSVTSALLNAYYRNGITQVFLTAGTVMTDISIPAGMTVNVVGTLVIGTTTLNAAQGGLDLSEGDITGSAGGVLIVKNAAAVAGKVTTVDVIELSDNLPAVGSGDIAVSSLAIDTPTAAAAFAAYAMANKVYIIEDLTLNSTVAFTGVDVVVYGDLIANVAADLSGATGVVISGDLIAGDSVTLGGNVTLQGALAAKDDISVTGLNNFTGVLDTGGYEITAAAATINLAEVAGGGTLLLSGAVTAVSIDGGNGNVKFTDTLLSLGASNFDNTGLTEFDVGANDVGVTGAVRFAGLVSFSDDLALSGSGAVTFSDTASFINGKGITFGAGTLNAIILGPDGSLALTDGPVILASSSGNVTLTPVADTSLTIGTGGTITQDTTGGTAHSITIGGAAVLSGTYTVASESGEVGTLSVDTAGDLQITGAGSLVLTGAPTGEAALLTGDGKVSAGGVEIVGGDDGWEAIDTGTEAIIIKPDTITTASGDAVLTAQDIDSVIRVKATAIPLAVNGQIDLTAFGTVTLVGGSTPGSLLLKGDATAPGILITDSSYTDPVTINAGISITDFVLADSGSTVEVIVTKNGVPAATGIVAESDDSGGDASSGAVLGRIGGGASDAVLLTGPTSGQADIVNSWTVTVPN